MSDSTASSTNTAALAFLIDAPLQAWGSSSRFEYRETEAFPTKSALLGLVAAALGIDKHDVGKSGILAELTSLRATVYALPRKGETLRLRDFHTIGGGYDRKDEKLRIPRQAAGGTFGTVITRRTYLTDARFAAALEGSSATVRCVIDALKDPVWGVWFGRKTCLPALPLAPTSGADSSDAIKLLIERVAEWDGCKPCEPAALECWEEPIEIDPSKGDFYLADSPISFRDRTFTTRPVRHSGPKRGGENAS